MTPNYDNLVNHYLEEEMTSSQKAIIAAALAALPITAYLGHKARQALGPDAPTATPQVQQTQPLPPINANLPEITPDNMPPHPHEIPVSEPTTLGTNRAPENTPERIMDDIRVQGTIEDHIIEHEDIRIMGYDDGADNPTIGIGHFLNGSADDIALFTQLFGNELNYDRLVAGSGQVRRDGVPQIQQNLGTTPRGVELLNNGIQPQAMTEEQVRVLFNHDIENVYVPRARRNLETHLDINLDDLAEQHQAAWVDLQFRGDFGGELRRIIRQAREEQDMGIIVTGLQARAQRQGLEHVRDRIDRNAVIIQTHLQELVPQQQNNR
jgi:hypothetical protein